MGSFLMKGGLGVVCSGDHCFGMTWGWNSLSCASEMQRSEIEHGSRNSVAYMYGGIEGLLNSASDGQNVRGKSSGNWEGTRKYN